MIAGSGDVPELIAQQSGSNDCQLITIALSPQVASRLAPYCAVLEQYGPGQLSKIIRTFQRYEIRQIIIVGKIEKRFFFAAPRLDLRTLRGISQLRDYRDVTVWQAVVAEFAREGLEVVEQTGVLGHLLTPTGVLGKWQPTRSEWEDMRYGFKQAKQLAGLDIGQTVVVRRGTVLAVESVEGTDATIERGCRYSRRGAIVVKVNRPQQDMRFDVPAVGPHTLTALVAGHARVLAVEAETTLMLHLEKLIATANTHRLVLAGVSAALLSSSVSSGNS